MLINAQSAVSSYAQTVSAVSNQTADSTTERVQNTATTPIQDTYTPSDTTTSTEELGTYSPNTALVEQLKAESKTIQDRFVSMVEDMLAKQGKQIAVGEGIWKTLASGDFTVDAETQAAAKEAISEEGYWGVKQTSERLIRFAKALTGGDPTKAEDMRAAFIKGFEAAGMEWGTDLPGITAETYEATMKLFDEWAAEGNTATSQAETTPTE